MFSRVVVYLWVRLASYLDFLPRIQNNFAHKTFVLLVFATLSLTPALAEEPQESLVLSSQEIKKPEASAGVNALTIVGSVPEYDRGDYIHLECIMPSGESKEFVTFGSKEGDYHTTINIDKSYEVGDYEIVLKYQGIKIASASFKIV